MHGYAFSQEEGGVVSQFELIRSYSAVDVHTKVRLNSNTI